MYAVSPCLKRHYPLIRDIWIFPGWAEEVGWTQLKCKGNSRPNKQAPCVHNQLVPARSLRARGDGPGHWASSQVATRLQSRAELLLASSYFYSILNPGCKKIRDKLKCNDEFFQSQRKLCLSSSCIWATLFLIGSLSKVPQVQTGITAVQHKAA